MNIRELTDWIEDLILDSRSTIETVNEGDGIISNTLQSVKCHIDENVVIIYGSDGEEVSLSWDKFTHSHKVRIFSALEVKSKLDQYYCEKLDEMIHPL